MLKQTILVLLFACSGSLAAKPKAERVNLVKTTRHCSKELQLPREDANKLLRGILERNDQKAQCFVKCFYVQTKIMDEAGNIDEERLKNVLPKAIFPPNKVSSYFTFKNSKTEQNRAFKKL